MSDIIDEFHDGLDKGFKSFVFMGDCTGGYGFDIGETLGSLLNHVMGVGGNFTLMLTDITPSRYLHSCDEIMALCCSGRMPSLYIATQSANDRILGLMRRPCDMDRVKKHLQELAAVDPLLILRTSIIAGFPSEKLEELDETIDFCREVGFKKIYWHGYSNRPGVESSQLPGQLSLEEIEYRCEYVHSCLGDRVTISTIPGRGARFYVDPKHAR